jgi:hypothetical protein
MRLEPVFNDPGSPFLLKRAAYNAGIALEDLPMNHQPTHLCPHCGGPLTMPAAWSPDDPVRKLAGWGLWWVYWRLFVNAVGFLFLVAVIGFWVVMFTRQDIREKVADALNSLPIQPSSPFDRLPQGDIPPAAPQ